MKWHCSKYSNGWHFKTANFSPWWCLHLYFKKGIDNRLSQTAKHLINLGTVNWTLASNCHRSTVDWRAAHSPVLMGTCYIRAMSFHSGYITEQVKSGTYSLCTAEASKDKKVSWEHLPGTNICSLSCDYIVNMRAAVIALQHALKATTSLLNHSCLAHIH